MRREFRAFAAVGVAVAAIAGGSLLTVEGLRADVTSQSGEIQLQLGHEFFREGRFSDALDAYKRALTASVPADARAARSGVVQSALRVAEFATARTEAARLMAE